MKLSSIAFSLALALVTASIAAAQLPPDAVMLDKVKVSEKQKSHELDPVTLEDAVESLGTDCIEKDMTDDHRAALGELLTRAGIDADLLAPLLREVVGQAFRKIGAHCFCSPAKS